MTNSDLPMMPWFPQDFLSATVSWTFEERSVYRALLDHEWILRVLPNDEVRLARLAGIEPERFAVAWPLVKTKFVVTPEGLVNERCEQHRQEALRRKSSHQRAAAAMNAVRSNSRVKHTRATHEQRCEVSNVQRDVERESISTSSSSSSLESLSSSSSPSDFVSRETTDALASAGADAWRTTAGLNVDAFESYLNHVAILVREGRVRATLPPHSRVEQARWLAMQGNYSRQFDVVTRAIRNGWKILQSESDNRRSSSTSGSRFDATHAKAGDA